MVEALNKAIEAAEGVLKGDESGEVTQAAVQEASASLNKAVKALEEKPARRNGEEGVSQGFHRAGQEG